MNEERDDNGDEVEVGVIEAAQRVWGKPYAED